MHQVNSSTSSSEGAGAGRAATTPASLAIALGWTLDWLATIEVGLTLALFAACVVHVRWRLGHAPAAKAAA